MKSIKKYNFSRLKKLVGAKGFGVVKTLLLELLTRLYRYEMVRVLVRPFIKTRIPKKWVFLVGCYNSGTTITRELLGLHPSICTMPREGVRFTSVLPQPEDCGWERMWIKCRDYMKMPSAIDPEKTKKMIKDWSPWWSGDGDVFLEKSISNVSRMRWLDEHFPNAYFIGMTRNGYCAAEGIKRKAVPTAPEAKALNGQYTIDMAAEQWLVANEMLLKGANQVERYLQISYEDLVSDPMPVVKSIFSFLGLEVSEIRQSNDGIYIFEHYIGLKNMNDTSMSNLTAEDYAIMNPIISDMMADLGYEVREV